MRQNHDPRKIEEKTQRKRRIPQEEEDLVKGEVGAMFGGKAFDSCEGNIGRVVQIIHHHRLIPSQKQLQHRVTSDVAGATSYQYSGRHRFMNSV